jgi:hypothetical protein
MHSSQIGTYPNQSERSEASLFDSWSTQARSRPLTVLFRRDPARDRENRGIIQHGYEICWPEGHAVAVGLDALCHYGLRWLGLNRLLAGAHERLMVLTCLDLESRDDDLTKMTGHRTRRVTLRREGRIGRIHFIDGTPTEVIFVLGRDEQPVLDWIGLSTLADGELRWLDVSAGPADAAVRQSTMADATG